MGLLTEKEEWNGYSDKDDWRSDRYLSTSYGYNGNRQLVSETNARGIWTRYGYDSSGGVM